MKTKYTKKQITGAIAHWKKVLERMQTSESMNESNWSKPKLDIEALKRAVIAAKQEDDEHSLPSKFFGDAIDFNASSHDFNATVSGSNIVLQDGFYMGNDQNLKAEAKHPIKWIYFWFDTEDAALDWYKSEFGIEYNRDLLVKPTKRDMPGKFDDKFGIGMHK